MEHRVLWNKLAASLGSALPDSTKSEAATRPVAPVVVENKSAPGRTGPKGLAPRTTYSRVNVGAPPTTQVGVQQKAAPIRGMEFLPPKVAAEESSMTTMMKRPSLQDLVKQAMEGTASKADVTAEAARQLGHPVEPQEKTASDESLQGSDHIPTELCVKYAEALEYLSKEATEAGPGKGPNPTPVLEAVDGKGIDAPDLGSATQKNQPPENPPTESPSENPKSPANAMETNADMSHPEQPVDPMQNGTCSIAPQKQAAAELAGKNLAHLQKIGKLSNLGSSAIPKGSDADKDGQVGEAAKAPMPMQLKDKLGAAELLARNLEALGLGKQAEDAINPAQISAGKASATGEQAPDGSSGAEETPVPPKPADANAQASLVGSNEGAINYTKRDAKAKPKAEMGKLLSEPALSKASDPVLHKAFANADAAGTKISAAKLTKTAAAQALLLKLAKEQEDAKCKAGKKKSSQMGGLSTPSGQSGFSSANMGSPLT